MYILGFNRSDGSRESNKRCEVRKRRRAASCLFNQGRERGLQSCADDKGRERHARQMQVDASGGGKNGRATLWRPASKDPPGRNTKSDAKYYVKRKIIAVF